MILDELAAYAQQRVLADKQAHPLEELKQRCETVSPRTPFAFEQALRADALSFICEVKKASPSKGIIAQDFTVDEYQIYQAKLMGADAVLLICAILDTQTIARYLGICETLGLTALVEAHDAAEIQSAVDAGARVIGVNNRNLKDFSVDFSNASRLRDLIPPESIYVAESGVSCAADVAALRSIGADAVLMGEVLMRAPDKTALLREMRHAGLNQ